MAPIIRRQIWDGPATMKSAGHPILVVDKNITALAHLADHYVILEKGGRGIAPRFGPART